MALELLVENQLYNTRQYKNQHAASGNPESQVHVGESLKELLIILAVVELVCNVSNITDHEHSRHLLSLKIARSACLHLGTTLAPARSHLKIRIRFIQTGERS